MSTTVPIAWTAKGLRTRNAIIDSAAHLIHEYGVAGTSIDDVKATARISGSQLYHYFADKDALVEAVVARQADAVVDAQRLADLRTPSGVWAWCDAVVASAAASGGRGGCPLGSLGSQVAETHPTARDRIAVGFDAWAALLRDGLEHLRADGDLISDVDTSRLAWTVLATLQGGLLLAQVNRDPAALRNALTTLMMLIVPVPVPRSRA